MKYVRFIVGGICLLLIGGTLRFMLNPNYPKEADLIRLRKKICLHEDSLVIRAFDFLMQNTSVPKIENLLNKKECDTWLLEKDIVHAVDVYLESNLKWNIPFDVFCEYVLPPFVYHEDYIYWRKICYDKYADWVNRKKSIVEICSVINADLMKDFVFSDSVKQVQNWIQFQRNKKGNCIHMSQMILYPLRALGIPVAIDYVIAWGNVNGAHTWNSLYNNGKMIPFMGLEKVEKYNPFLIYEYAADTTKNAYRYAPKVYRKTFSMNKGYADIACRFPQKVKDIKLFNDLHFKDVTREYFPAKTVLVEELTELSDLCFLSVFNSNEWIPAAAAISHNRKVLFEDMNTNLLYLYQDSHHSFPFILDQEGKQKILLADDSRKIAFTIRWLCSREMEFQKSWNKFSIEYFDGIAKDSYRSSPVNDSTYILCAYRNSAWQPIAEAVCRDEKLSFTEVPANGLYILADRMNKIKSQCFTYQSNAVVFW